MRGVIARPSRRLQEIRVWFFALEIFHPPRAPERFQFFFRKFHRHILNGGSHNMRSKFTAPAVRRKVGVAHASRVLVAVSRRNGLFGSTFSREDFELLQKTSFICRASL